MTKVMSNKFLGRMIAGAALGGASLLVFTPSAALADGGYHPDGQGWGNSGRVYTKPHVAKAGDKIEIVEVCPGAQQHAWLWSRVTGKVDLTPRQHGDHPAGGESQGDWNDGGRAENAEKAQEPGDYREYRGEDSARQAPSTPGPSAEATPGPSPSASGRPGGGHQPSTGQPGRAGFEYGTSVTIPQDAEPGSYELKGSCGVGELIVAPKGWVDGGSGRAASGDGDNLAVAGTALLGLAALGGLTLARRRRTDESLD